MGFKYIKYGRHSCVSIERHLCFIRTPFSFPLLQSWLGTFSDNSVFLQRQAWFRSKLDGVHSWVPRKKWHRRHLAHVGKGLKCLCYPMNFCLTMICIQSKLQYNAYRVDKTGKNWKYSYFWKISSFNTGKIKVDKNSTFSDKTILAKVLLTSWSFWIALCLKEDEDYMWEPDYSDEDSS